MIFIIHADNNKQASVISFSFANFSCSRQFNHGGTEGTEIHGGLDAQDSVLLCVLRGSVVIPVCRQADSHSLTNIIHPHDALYLPTTVYCQILHCKKESMRKFLIMVLGSALIPLAGFAHEGHGTTDGFTITHYFVEPEHAIYTWSFVMAGAILISYYRLKKKRSSK